MTIAVDHIRGPKKVIHYYFSDPMTFPLAEASNQHLRFALGVVYKLTGIVKTFTEHIIHTFFFRDQLSQSGL